MLPALIMFLAFAFIPMIGVLVLSFTSWDGISPITFTGLASWREVLTDPGLYHSLAVTFAVMICSWLVQTPISLLLGTFLAGRQRYRAAAGGAVLPAAADVVGRRGHRLQVAAGPLLRPRAPGCTWSSCPRTGSVTRGWPSVS